MKSSIVAATVVMFSLLNAENVSELNLEKSSDMQNWEQVPVTQEMLTENGGILIPTDSPQEFYRMQVRLLSLPNIENPTPSTTSINEGESVTFTINVEGPDVTYQWFIGESGDVSQPIEGATSNTFNTGALFDDAAYWVQVTNSVGSRNSETARVSINRPPTIVTQPESTTILEGDTATLSVEVTGSNPMNFQWYRGNLGLTTNPVGTNSSTFTTPALTANTTYWVFVSNAFGISFGSQATVSVIPPVLPPTIEPPPLFNPYWPPTIFSFDSSSNMILSGNSSTLSWSVFNATTVEIDPEIGVVAEAGSIEVAPEDTTTYTLTATNAYGVSQLEVTVTVIPEGFALIPAGSFTMGRTSGDMDSDAPSVNVTVSAFYIGKYEVTTALWDEVRTWAVANGYTDLATGAGKAADHPVLSVSWWDVVKWCNARSEKEGLTPCYTVSEAVMKTGTTAPTVNWSANGYRLPTEAEWEKAARDWDSGDRFPGYLDTIDHSWANFRNVGGESYQEGTIGYHPTYATGSTPYTSPVGSFWENGYGLYDMAGNVYEWCWDWYGSSTYVNGATDPRGAASGTNRVARGGSWSSYAVNCRAAARNSSGPANQHNYIGFRIARSSVP